MFKNFFSLVMLCSISILIYAEHSTLPQNLSEINKSTHAYNIEFNCIKSPAFAALVDVLSAESKLEFEHFVDKIKTTLVNSNEIAELINKYSDLYTQYINFQGRVPKVHFIFSVEDERSFSLANDPVVDFENFKRKLSEDELIQLSKAIPELEVLMFDKFEQLLSELEHSQLRKELKEKSENKHFIASGVIS